MTNEKAIHSQRMAGWLIYNGHKLIKICDNKRQPGFNIFIFAETSSLRTDMERYQPRNTV
ncbi:hypothetical protein JCM10914A_11050 [Paenibacillus sp. JCM 10914]|uniref:DUF5659 domain-containing protein n=1 Tax=Paenibacillus sp. JCM 10914 TaxID=1236974 RepID=UPI0003CC707C|nr:DUF5659 domain-containing protein [Paenibacillus sp. JCM 10914]GAE08150.1 hypothetical protein JCM10914_4416 [Paenibacillus sp. JCM 10914]